MEQLWVAIQIRRVHAAAMLPLAFWVSAAAADLCAPPLPPPVLDAPSAPPSLVWDALAPAVPSNDVGLEIDETFRLLQADVDRRRGGGFDVAACFFIGQL